MAKSEVTNVNMRSLKLNLQHCYGIKSLSHTFDFSDQRVFAIYAPNGVMKSSLANVFADVASGVPSSDRMFPDRLTVRVVTDQDCNDIPSEQVVVLQPYDEQFGPNESTSTLLVDSQLRKEYETLQLEIDAAKATLLAQLKIQSHSRKNLEVEVSATFTSTQHDFLRALIRVREELSSQSDSPFDAIPYDTIFDEKVVAQLKKDVFRNALAEYVGELNRLLDASTYFGRKTFNYYNAAAITKSLDENGFFQAKHSVNLNAEKKVEIVDKDQLEELINQEKEEISNDPKVRESLNAVEKGLNRNAEMRDFHSYISDHIELLPELLNIDHFRESVWKSYLKAQVVHYEHYLDTYGRAEIRIGEIEEAARQQRTQWEEVIEIFNQRFFVPFRLRAKNREKVVLGQEPLPVLGFTFEDGIDSANVEREPLLITLSTGEKKALYILNVLFEIEARRRSGQETIFVIDDIADSFDYKNKYAIIQYLNEIADTPNFVQILLTHNFDFFRTVESRFIRYHNCLMAIKDDNSVSLVQATGIRNPFIHDWKPHFYDDRLKRIASIPFIRNIVEYTMGEHDPNYLVLTSLLHWKAETNTVTEGDLDALFASTFHDPGGWPLPSNKVVDDIRLTAMDCLAADVSINFENKIVLSIAIRLAAEQFMIAEIDDDSIVANITTNQTRCLFDAYKDGGAATVNAISALEKVLLMTPENIHLNSFMYEPILDMSDQHLRSLYKEVLEVAGHSVHMPII